MTDATLSTPLEIAISQVAGTDEEAFAEYKEAMQASAQDDGPQEANDPHGRPSTKWEPGKSSIYVDAFNLALDTVLEDEAHLFSVDELEVFVQWRKLGYQAQYL